jgi:hypothetical protein
VPGPLRIVAGVLAVALLAATLSPCPPLATQSSAHDQHAQRVAIQSQALEVSPVLNASCPCGCREGRDTALANARLGVAELSQIPEPPAPHVYAALEVSEVRIPAAPDLGTDPVPI